MQGVRLIYSSRRRFIYPLRLLVFKIQKLKQRNLSKPADLCFCLTTSYYINSLTLQIKYRAMGA